MSVKRNVVANFVGNGWGALVGIVFAPLYINYLGIESYGLIGFFLALQAWLFMLDLGLTPALNREMARFSAGLHTPESICKLLRSVEIIYAWIAVSLTIAIYAFSTWIATSWLNIKALAPNQVIYAISLMGAVIGVQWMSVLYRNALLGLQKQVWLSSVTAGVATVRAFGALLVLAYLSPTITAFFQFLFAVSVAELIVLAISLKKKLPKPGKKINFSLKAIYKIRQFAGGVAVITVLSTVLMQLDKLLLALILPLDKFGYFTLAVSVSGALSLVTGSLFNVAYPQLTEIAASKGTKELAEAYHNFSQLLSMVLLPLAAMLAFFSKEIIYIWTKDSVLTEYVAPILTVWIIGSAFNGIMHIPYALQLAHGWTKLATYVNLVAFLVMLPSILVFAPTYGAIAAAWVWTAINVGYFFIVIGLMHRQLLETEIMLWYVDDIMKPLFMSVSVASILYLIRLGIQPQSRMGELVFIFFGTLLLLLVTALTVPAGRNLVRHLIHWRQI